MNTEIGQDIKKAKDFLQKRQLVAIPTETVYGLAGNAYDEQAILKIFEIKQRPKFNPIIIHLDRLEKAKQLTTHIPEIVFSLADRFWPGPLTILLKKSNRVPGVLTAGLPYVGIRIPNHQVALSLLSKLDFPLAAPSANPFGYVSPTQPNHVYTNMKGKIPYILDGGECSIGIESTVVGFEKEKIIVHRLGGITLEELRETGVPVMIQNHSKLNSKAPGMLASHYSPKTKLMLGDIDKNFEKCDNPKKVGVLSFNQHSKLPNVHQKILSPTGNLQEAAKNLFTFMRDLDDCDLEYILAEKLPDSELGTSINDRLMRAAVK